jgi:hypothetical protein
LGDKFVEPALIANGVYQTPRNAGSSCALKK